MKKFIPVLLLLLASVPGWASLQTCTGAFNITTAAAGNTQTVNFPVGCASFTPAVLIFTTTGQTSATTQATQALDLKGSWGVATSTSNRVALAYSSIHGTTPAATASMNRVDGSIATVTTAAALEGVADVTTFGSGSFTLTIGTAFPSSYTVAFFAIGGSDIVQAQVAAYTKTTTFGKSNQTYTLPFANPSVLMFINSSPALGAAPSAVVASQFNFGAWDGYNQWYNTGYCTNGGASSTCNNAQDMGHVMEMTTGSNVVTANSVSVVGVSGTTLTLNWDNHTTGNTTPSTAPFYILEIRGGIWQVGNWNVSHTLNTVTGMSNVIKPTGAIFFTAGNLNAISPQPIGTFEPVWGFADQNGNAQAMCGKDITGSNPTKTSLGYCPSCGLYRIEAGGGVGIQYDTISMNSTGFTGNTSVTSTVADQTSFVVLMGSNAGGSTSTNSIKTNSISQ